MSDVHRHYSEGTDWRPPVDHVQRRARRFVAYEDGRGVEERVTRECRDCGTAYTVPADKARSGSKWYSLCPSCLYWEI